MHSPPSRASEERASSRSGPSTPISRASSATWYSVERRRRTAAGCGSATHSRLPGRAVPAASAHAAHHRAHPRHCRARRALRRPRRVLAVGRRSGAGRRGCDLILRARARHPARGAWLGTSAIGDLVDDRLLVYLWLKPVSRWQLLAAAVLATASVVVPLAALPVAATALVAGAGDVALPALLAAALAGFAYAGLFVAAGFWFRRAIWCGLAFARRLAGRDGSLPASGHRLAGSAQARIRDRGFRTREDP